ncbi:MAG: thermonuclease family protein [Nitrospirota bacterium]
MQFYKKITSFGYLLFCLIILLLILPTSLFAHGGGLDSLGCHHDRKRGGYHCHRGPLAGQYFNSKQEALDALNLLREKPKESKKQKEDSEVLKEKVEFRKVIRIIDGDTIVLDGGEKVRLIGVDTPETKDPRKPVEYFGWEATRFTKEMVEGKRVRLEYDWQRQDKYERTLAYIFLEDGTFLNAEIIKQGYGFAYTKYPFKYLEEFRQYEREARENSRGLWK